MSLYLYLQAHYITALHLEEVYKLASQPGAPNTARGLIQIK